MWIIFGVEFAIVAGLFLLARVPLTYNVQNLKVRWKTTAMTALAFTLVVSLLSVMLAFVNGMTELTSKSGQPSNLIVLAEGAIDESFSNLSPDGLGDVESQPGIARKNGQPLASRETYLIVSQPIPNAKPKEPKSRFLQVRGIDDPVRAAGVHGIHLQSGGDWFSDAGVRENPDEGQPLVEAVIGSGIAAELGKDRPLADGTVQPLKLGDTFTLNARPWVVVGIMDAAGTTFDSEVWGKRSLLGPMFGKNDCSSLVLRAESPERAKELVDYFVNKGGKGYSKLKLNAMTELDYFKSLQTTSTTFLVAAWIVTGILAIGGMFGILNTMFASVSQRISDIGVLRLLGYPRLQILVSFLLESIMIATIGGLLGCALGTLCDGWSATSIVGGQGGNGKTIVLELMVTLPTLLAGMLLSIGMGLVGGLLPAMNAMRLSALDALR
jgi:hypothetical protein